MSQRESLPRTMIVAGVLCVVCSLGVSAAAVVLKPLQEANKVLDRQRNILDATGIAFDETGNPASELSGDQVDEYFSWISPGFLDFETGQLIDESQLGVED
ncbi:MAG: Na(+)-translocating NADH-quinone reductase subunit C, partial [Planctomycetota bacterium]